MGRPRAGRGFRHAWRRHRRLLAVLGTVAVSSGLLASLAAGQIILGGYGRSGIKWAKAGDFDGSFIYCRGFFRPGYAPEPSGQGWSTDYPAADNNFSVRLAELTRTWVNKDQARMPKHVVVRLDDPLLYRCPMLFMEDVGTIGIDEEEVAHLRAYLQKGGFLWVDDFWGERAWRQWEYEIHRVLPRGPYKIIDIPNDHAILRSLYKVEAIPQVPSIRHYRQWGDTSEFGPQTAEVHFRGIEDEAGRLMVVMTHNTDIADTWEREGEEPREYFERFSPRGYAVGVNVVLYTMTH